jgi:hypothetical protein
MTRRLTSPIVKSRIGQMKKPHFTPEEEAEIARAERIGARAEMIEAGVGEFLRNRMPKDEHLHVATELLNEVIELRQEARDIHNKVGRHGRRARAGR